MLIYCIIASNGVAMIITSVGLNKLGYNHALFYQIIIDCDMKYGCKFFFGYINDDSKWATTPLLRATEI